MYVIHSVSCHSKAVSEDRDISDIKTVFGPWAPSLALAYLFAIYFFSKGIQRKAMLRDVLLHIYRIL